MNERIVEGLVTDVEARMLVGVLLGTTGQAEIIKWEVKALVAINTDGVITYEERDVNGGHDATDH